MAISEYTTLIFQYNSDFNISEVKIHVLRIQNTELDFIFHILDLYNMYLCMYMYI